MLAARCTTKPDQIFQVLLMLLLILFTKLVEELACCIYHHRCFITESVEQVWQQARLVVVAFSQCQHPVTNHVQECQADLIQQQYTLVDAGNACSAAYKEEGT